jgi:hypothetical protein
LGDVEVTFCPAGHVLGSAQIRIANRDEVVAPGPAPCFAMEPLRASTMPIAKRACSCLRCSPWLNETRPGRTAIGLATHFEGEQGAAEVPGATT